ncbi:hypothetical protein CA51_05230 [Rosistilla oblonga]|uniref:hypothetical protein n=1 Tax=Rosistilla oblonga TaxID=2527990 RepID=UPI001188DCC0|nr:hypothetical protein [Rosistilla oblonga]QDV10673.1 hypothetical protein CA51_05230 [Rosistilla oblonga]
MPHLAAISYAMIIIGVILFQCCLIAGAPWGPLTQGGQHPGALPAKGRVVALLSAALLAFMAAGITSAAGLAPHWQNWTGWAALGVQSLSTLLNWITPSRPERRLWGPVTSIMLGLATYAVVAGK